MRHVARLFLFSQSGGGVCVVVGWCSRAASHSLSHHHCVVWKKIELHGGKPPFCGVRNRLWRLSAVVSIVPRRPSGVYAARKKRNSQLDVTVCDLWWRLSTFLQPWPSGGFNSKSWEDRGPEFGRSPWLDIFWWISFSGLFRLYIWTQIPSVAPEKNVKIHSLLIGNILVHLFKQCCHVSWYKTGLKYLSVVFSV